MSASLSFFRDRVFTNSRITDAVRLVPRFERGSAESVGRKDKRVLVMSIGITVSPVRTMGRNGKKKQVADSAPR